jgi:hypothetical protein
MKAIGLSQYGYVIAMQERLKKGQNDDALCRKMLTAVASILGLTWGDHAKARPVDFVPIVAAVVSAGLVLVPRS